MMISQDQYGEVFNSQETYQGIADILKQGKPVVIGWTDLEGSHLDILFTLYPKQIGSLQRGLRGNSDLFVSIMGFGAHGFKAQEKEVTHPGYFGEKLRLGVDNITTDKVAELINGVRSKL